MKPTAYTFITEYPRPREVFACDMKMRIIHHYIDMRIRPYMEAAMTKNSYNNRVGYGNWKAINAVSGKIIKVSEGFKKDCYIGKLDLKGFFPNAIWKIAYESLIKIIPDDYPFNDKDDLIYLIHESIYSYPTHNCFIKSDVSKWELIEYGKSLFDKEDGIGGAIGHLIWQNCMNLYLNDFDHWIVDELKFEYVRFVDDMIFIVEDKNKFLNAIPKIRERLAEIGCRLSENKFYLQHYSKGLEFLGSRIKPRRKHFDNRTVTRAFNKVEKYNKKPYLNFLYEFVSSLNSFVGSANLRAEKKHINLLKEKINKKWYEYFYFYENKNGTKRCFRIKSKYKQMNIYRNRYGYKCKRKKKLHKRYDRTGKILSN